MIRALLVVGAFLSALFLPVWVTCILAIVLASLWESWEVIFLGVIIDLIYMPPGGILFIPMPATLAAIALVWVMIPIRNRLLVGKGH